MARVATIDAESDILDDCQDAIAYRFRRVELLRAALTHTSGANTRAASNERLEFLGDSVLGLVCCDLLFERYPDFQEGEMTRVKSAVVSRRTCARIAKRLGLDEFLILGKGMPMREMPSNMLADAYESLVGAVYLDGGLDAAKPFVLRDLEPEIEKVAAGEHDNHKSLLQQIAQKNYGDTPRYRVLDEQGPDHNKCFKIAAEIAKTFFPAAWGCNKKEAEQRAAMNAMAFIQGDEVPYPADG